MTAASETSARSTSSATTNATSSPASADGPLLCVSPDGPTTGECGPAARRARTTRSQARSTASAAASTESEADLRALGWISSPQGRRALSCLRTSPASARGLPKSRDAWRALATEWPRPNERLPVLVRLIYAGACGLLPTVTARDYRNPGLKDHPRLSATRGEPLPETFGLPLPAALAGWLMGFPPEWLQCAPSGTQSTRGQRAT